MPDAVLFARNVQFNKCGVASSSLRDKNLLLRCLMLGKCLYLTQLQEHRRQYADTADLITKEHDSVKPISVIKLVAIVHWIVQTLLLSPQTCSPIRKVNIRTHLLIPDYYQYSKFNLKNLACEKPRREGSHSRYCFAMPGFRVLPISRYFATRGANPHPAF